MTTTMPSWLRAACSDARLAPYLAATGGDVAEAAVLYTWNVQASKEFYWSLHFLEVAFRNAAHTQLAATHRSGAWWRVVPLKAIGLSMIRDAERRCRREGKDPVSPDDVVAQVPFGFWVSLLATHYDRDLWVPTLHRTFPYYQGRRKDLYESFEAMRRLRNRIMHFEPIHHRLLAADHQTISALLGYIDPAIAAEVALVDPVPALLAGRAGSAGRAESAPSAPSVVAVAPVDAGRPSTVPDQRAVDGRHKG